MFDATSREGLLQLHRAGTRWLSTGWAGGFTVADAAYLATVPDDWDHVELDTYESMRRSNAGFAADGPTLLTAVDVADARGAHAGAVVAYATVGLTNPAVLPMHPAGQPQRERSNTREPGTVNLIVGTTRSLDDAAMAGLLATCVEAKAATLLHAAGVPGTTTDAIVVGCDPSGEPARFAGSATSIGGAARSCVREAVTAAAAATYPEGAPDPTETDQGITTNERAEVFRP